MAHQRPWNKYEVALLIECYVNVTEKGCSQKEELTRLSSALRQMARNEGLEIDEVYRNLNGVHWQYGFMKAVFEGVRHDGKPSRLFFDMVALYRSDKTAFYKLLEEAHRLSSGKGAEATLSEKVKNLFFDWLRTRGIKEGVVKSWTECLCHVSKYALGHSISKVDFWAIQNFHDFNRIRSSLLENKIFKFKHPIDSRTFDKAGKMYADFLKEQMESSRIDPRHTSSLHIAKSGNTTNDKSKKGKMSCTASFPVDYEKRISQFSEWMFQDRHLAAKTVTSYATGLKNADRYALEQGILSESLTASAGKTLEQAIEKLLSDERFSEYNSEQHHRFSAAIHAYRMFRLAEDSGFRHSPVNRKKLGDKSEEKCSPVLRELLMKKFPYGIRLDSSLDMMKLRGFAESVGVALPKDEELLKSQIAAGGDAFEGKIYFIANDTLLELENRVQAIFDTGACVIYYDKLYDSDFSWFDEHYISSSEHMRELLKSHMDEVFCSRNFIHVGSERINELEAVEGELKRVWGNCVTHTYSEVYGLLPYVPDDKVRFYLSKSDFFVWSASETFAWLDRIVISDAEKDEIWKYVDSACETAGFASISEVPLESIVEENYEISINAIYDAVYRIVLVDHFQINGKILTRKDRETDALTLTKAYCAGKDECLLSDLNAYVVSITGTSNRQTTFRAAYDQMVRVTKEKFVKEDAVQFDVDAIDALLDELIKGDFASIKSIATFIMFPSCGYTWNHYILESFCYRFSKKYRLEFVNFNDKNAGILVKKSCTVSYVDMLVRAVAHAGIDLSVENVGRYLCDNGYTAKSKMVIFSEVAEKAQEQRRQSK